MYYYISDWLGKFYAMGSPEMPLDSYRVAAGGRINPQRPDAVRRLAVGYKESGFTQRDILTRLIKDAQSHGNNLDHPNNIFHQASGSCLNGLKLSSRDSTIIWLKHDTLMGKLRYP